MSSLTPDLEALTVSVITYNTEIGNGGVDSVTGVVNGTSIWEVVFRDMQIISNFRAQLTILRGINFSDEGYFVRHAGKMLALNEVDLATGIYYLTPNRAAVAGPLLPYVIDSLNAFFIPPEQNADGVLFLLPLKFPVLISWIVVVTLAVAVLQLLIQKIHVDEENLHPRQAENLLTVISFLTQSGYGLLIRQSKIFTSLNILLFFISFLSFFLSALFSAKLLSFILHPAFPIKNSEDLIEKGYTFYAFPNAEHFMPSGLPRRRFDSNNTLSASMEAVLKERHAHVDVGWDTMGGFLWHFRFKNLLNFSEPEEKVCTLLSTTNWYNSRFSRVFYVAPDNFKLRSMLNRSILKIKEIGLLWKYVQYPTVERMRCPSKIQPSYQEDLKFHDVSYAFYFLGLTMALAVLSVVVETVLSRKQNMIV